MWDRLTSGVGETNVVRKDKGYNYMRATNATSSQNSKLGLLV